MKVFQVIISNGSAMDKIADRSVSSHELFTKLLRTTFNEAARSKKRGGIYFVSTVCILFLNLFAALLPSYIKSKCPL